MKFGERLKAARTKLNLTQEMVAQELFVSRQTISSWENERSYPDIQSLIKLSNCYQLSLDILLKEDNGMVEEIKRKEELAKINRIWGISYGINLIFLLMMLLSQFVKGAAFEMGTGIRISLLVVMFLNVTLLLFATKEKERLKEEKSCFSNKSRPFIVVLLTLESVLFLIGGVLAFLKYSQAYHLLGFATGMLVTTIMLIVINKKLKEE